MGIIATSALFFVVCACPPFCLFGETQVICDDESEAGGAREEDCPAELLQACLEELEVRARVDDQLKLRQG
jgi:hypothetical protein